MAVDSTNAAGEERLELSSRMADLALVPPWIERLASEYDLPGNIQFAMNLCLEEVLSNIIRHGYANQPGRPIFVSFRAAPGSSVLVIEDQAPLFDPLTAPERPVEETLDGTRLGGLGIRLVRSFAASLAYEPTGMGNRLRIAFSTAA